MSTIAATNAPSSPAPVMTAATLTANLLKKDAMPIRQPPPIATHTSARMGWNSSFGRSAVVVVDLIERDGRHEHRCHNGKTRDHAEADFGVVLEPVAPEAVQQQGDGESEHGYRHHGVQDGETHIVDKPVEKTGDRFEFLATASDTVSPAPPMISSS